MICAVIVRKDHITNGDTDVNLLATQHIITKLNVILNNDKRLSKSKINNENSILLIDSINPKYDEKNSKIILNCLNSNTDDYKNHVIEDPIFIDSGKRQLTQLVDCIAYCLRRRFRANEPSSDAKKIISPLLFYH